MAKPKLKPKPKPRVARRSKYALKGKIKLSWWQIALIILAVALTGLLILRYSFASDQIDVIYKETQDERQRARSGQGNNEGVTVPCKVNADGTRSGEATGWAFDPLNSGASSQIHLYFDDIKSGYPITTNLASTDVNNAYRIGGTHRFAFAIPAQFYDGKQHSITGYSIGSAGNNFVGKIYFVCQPKTAVAPSTPKPPPSPPTPTPKPKPGIPTPPAAPKPADPKKVDAVVALFSGSNTQSGSSQKQLGQNTNNPVELVTVDLLDTTKNLSASDLLAIDKKIDDIPAEQLSTLTGSVILKPNISPEKEVVQVGYYLNKKLHFYSDKSPFDYDFDTTRVANGTYRLDVVGFDKDGTQVTRLVQKFNIENHLNFFERLRNDLTYPLYRLQNPN